MFQARLCPLNKVWPNILLSEEFRPIVVLSPLYKFLELRFLSKLDTYLTQKLDRNQIGFVKSNVNLGQYLASNREIKTIFS
jgi:hypothetical protein